MLNNQTIVDTALRLNDACWNTYASSPYVATSDSLLHPTADGLHQYRYRDGGIRILLQQGELHGIES